jgi:Uma2 family endonuclease
MPGDPARREATYADLEALPRHMVGEILHGVLHAFPRPRIRHARAASRLGGSLGPAFDRGHQGPGGWILLDEPELHLGRDVLVPDLAGWRRERLPELPDEAYFTLAPDWVCEVLSPATRAVDLTDKRDLYQRERVEHLWLVDPAAEACTLEVLRWSERGYVVVASHRGDAVVEAPPFEAVPLELGALWER